MTSVPPTQPPAAPETDVRLSDDERATLLRVLDWGVETRNMTYLVALKVLGIADRHAAALADLESARERVRVVEGERDAAMAETEMALRMHDVQWSRAESAEAAHRALQAAVAALTDEWAGHLAGDEIRALLAGGEER